METEDPSVEKADVQQRVYGGAAMRVKCVLGSVLLFCMLVGSSIAAANSDIRLDRESARVEVGKTFLLHALTNGAGDIWWSSSDSSVADFLVSPNSAYATVRGWKSGTAVITAHFSPAGSGASQNASCLVTVIPNANPHRVAAVRISPETVVAEKGKSVYLTATVVPDTALNKNVTWRTSNAGVAVVSPQGAVSALNPGHAIISAVSEDGGFFAECSVDVVDNEIRVEGIVLNHASTHVYVNGTRHLIAYITPANATNKRVRWVTSNWNIASVSQTGIVVGVRKGKAIISAITEDGGYIAESVVTVREDWLDFADGCTVGASSPLFLLILLPIIPLFAGRK